MVGITHSIIYNSIIDKRQDAKSLHHHIKRKIHVMTWHLYYFSWPIPQNVDPTPIEFFYSNEQTPTIFQNFMLIANPIKKIQVQKQIIQQLSKVPNIYIFLFFIINGRKWCQNITNNWWCQGTWHIRKDFIMNY
jgi:hypothetical protein